MTSTSGPGISLMAEFAGLAYFAEIPSVIWDIQRVGPSTGLPTRTCQSDIHFAYYLGHGDTRHVVLFPSSPAECFEFGAIAFDLSDQLQTLVFVLSDLDLGMNLWMSDPLPYPETPINRGKVLTKEQLENLKGQWGRFVDTDGDGVGYRTIPGTDHPLAGYFTRGTGHNAMAIYSERGDDWEENLRRLRRKFDTARDLVPAPEILRRDGATCGIISLGSNHPSLLETLDRLDSKGISCDYLRLKALPINDQVRQFIESFDQVFVVENNFDGQVHQILQHEMPHRATNLISTARCNGLPLTPDWLEETLMAKLKR